MVRSSRSSQSDLITSLNEVADSVSSAMDAAEMLTTIVERAKRITDTDKAVLVLTSEHGAELDLESIVVRGRRGQHLQEWWQERLEALGDTVFDTANIIVESHPEHHAWLLCSPVRVKDRPIGLICAINSADRPFSLEQIDFFAILSAFAASAIEIARLAEESRYMLLASERDRIAAEMHDGVMQELFSISVGLEVCKRQAASDPEATAVRLDALQQQLNASMTELRRIMYDLRPVRLSELGLAGAIEYWIHDVTADRTITGRLVTRGEQPAMSPAAEACLYQVAKEAVSNAARHSQGSRIDVLLDSGKGVVRLAVTDDGRGFDVDSTRRTSEGYGLRNIRERAEREGGIIAIDSSAERGTTIRVELPLGSE